MSDQPSNTASISPVEQLANVYASLADDVLTGMIEIDKETGQRASRIAHAAADKALASNKVLDSRGRFARRFGLHPATASIATGLALASTFFTWSTLGAGVIFEAPMVCIVGVLIFTMQKYLYGDELLPAWLKAIVVSVLAAIPIPLGPFVFIPAGILGWVWGKRRETIPK